MKTGRKPYGNYVDERVVIEIIKLKRRARKGAAGPTSYARIARELNDEGYTTATGVPWYAKIVKNIINRIENPEPKKAVKQVQKPALGVHDWLNIDQVEACRSACPDRDRVIFELLVAGGLRAAELCSSQIRDIDTDADLMNIRGKGGGGKVTRTIKIAAELAGWMKEYIDENRSGADPDDTLFVNVNGGPMKYPALLARIKKIAEKSGIKWLRPHKLRHTAAVFLYNYTLDLLKVKRFLGHKSVKTTEIYADTLESQNSEQAEGLWAATRK